jgi:hypothetical protein
MSIEIIRESHTEAEKGDERAVDGNGSGIRGNYSGDEPEKGTFSRSIRADDSKTFPFTDIKADPVEDFDNCVVL